MVASFLFVICQTLVFGQSADAEPSPETTTRLRQLEAQVEVLREELMKLRQAMTPAGGEEVGSAPARIIPAVMNAEVAQEGKPTPAAAETKPAAPARPAAGIDLGPVRVVPYGTIYFNAFSNSGGTNNTDVPLFAAPSGSGNLSASARQTRLGLRLEGPQVLNAKLTGALEVDFFGGFPAIGLGENFGVVRVRQAYARLDWKTTALVAGQDWMVFAPVNPASLSSAGIPLLAAAGNPWSRLPQIRLEKRWHDGALNLQGAVLAPGTGDTNAAFLLQPNAGASSRLPFFQSRLAFHQKNWLGLKKPGSIGLSAHYGRARVNVAAATHKIDSAGLALDWNLPLLPRVTLAGEGFFGRNLGGFQSGVFQGFNHDFAFRRGTTAVAGGARAIGTRGGWAQLGFTPPDLDTLTFYASYGLDDPRDEDLMSTTNINFRSRNQAYAFSFIHKLSAQLSWSLEYRRLETFYLRTGPRANNHLNLGVALGF